jgi:hypothetical protein
MNQDRRTLGESEKLRVLGVVEQLEQFWANRDGLTEQNKEEFRAFVAQLFGDHDDAR